MDKNIQRIFEAIEHEEDRQIRGIELIASENFVSDYVQKAQGSVLTNKYAEGYPGKRYYGGCEHVDVTEQAAIDYAKELFGADHANVQPHSGSSANLAVYRAFLEPGDRVLGMNLSEGGHLTHGSPVNFSGQSYDMYSYGLDEHGYIDYDEMAKTARESQPKLIIAGGSAYSRIIDFKAFRQVADEVGALFMVDMAHIAGLIAAGEHPNPVPYADIVTTTTHKTLRGPRGGMILCKEEYKKAIDSAIFPGIQGGPLEHVIAAKAVAFAEALQDKFKDYSRQVIANAKAMAEVFNQSDIKIISGGTDNHLMLLDLTATSHSGREAEKILESIDITVNKNSIPHETRSMTETSGIRIGTPAITTRGLEEKEAKQIAEWMVEALSTDVSEDQLASIKKAVHQMMDKRPLNAWQTA